MSRHLKSILVLLEIALSAGSIPVLHAAPPAQGPVEEATKAPYVFPTPIFIPTYPNEPLPPPATPASTAPKPPSGTSPQRQRTYTVVEGDSPWIIAKKVYGSGAKFGIILDANGLTETSVLKIGTILQVPPVDSAGNPPPIAGPTGAQATAGESAEIATPDIQAVPPVATPKTARFIDTKTETNMAELIVNILAFIFLVGAVIMGASALVFYRRSERIKKLETIAKRIRATK